MGEMRYLDRVPAVESPFLIYPTFVDPVRFPEFDSFPLHERVDPIGGASRFRGRRAWLKPCKLRLLTITSPSGQDYVCWSPRSPESSSSATAGTRKPLCWPT